MRPGKRTGAKRSEGSRYSKKPTGQDNVKIIKQVIVKPAEPAVDENIVYGRNAVMEVLKSSRTIETVYVAEGEVDGSLQKILAMARDNRNVVKTIHRKKLDVMTNRGNHQGVALRVTDYVYSDVSDLLAIAKERGEDPFLILLDEIEDPHNLGSIIRTAELCGAHGIVIPKRRSAGVTATVYKTSAGAVEHMAVARVSNLAQTTEEIKKAGIFVYGTDMEGTLSSQTADFSGPCALVIGNEGKGISKIMRDKCDQVVSIPMVGKLNSLNASVAGGIVMYEIMLGRLKASQQSSE